MSKKIVVGFICLLFVMLLGSLTIESYFNLSQNLKIYNDKLIDVIDQRMTSLFSEINNFPRTAADDILFLSALSCLEELTSFSIDKTTNDLAKIFDDLLTRNFLEFLKVNTAYYQLRYIDENGQAVVRVEFDGNNYKVISKNELQNKKDKYYFKQTIRLDKKEIFISPIDLNIENGEIENRGTEDNPTYVPVIRYGTPVFDNQGNKKGIIIANVYADYFLEDIRRFQRPRENVFLVNEKGYYLAHPDRDKEFAFMFDRDDNFYNDYPEIPKGILSDFSKRKIETDDFIFSFRRIYPTISSFEVYQGSEKILGENSENNYFWVLISASEKGELNKAPEGLEKNYLLSLLFSWIIVLIIIVLVFVLAFKMSDA